MATMKLIDALRKNQKQYKGMKLPKWEDCWHMSPEEFDRLWGDCDKVALRSTSPKPLIKSQ